MLVNVTMQLNELFQGTSKERFVAANLFGRVVVLLKFVDPQKKKAQSSSGDMIDISQKEFYELHITTERPKYEKGMHVLALKPFLRGKYNILFKPAVVQSCFTSEDKRKMYELLFDDGKNAKVHEEFVIPTQEKWNSKENEPEPKEATHEGEKESKSESLNEKEEEESESDSTCEEEKRKHKHKHHHHKKHNKKEKQAPQIIIIPIFVPMMPFMM